MLKKANTSWHLNIYGETALRSFWKEPQEERIEGHRTRPGNSSKRESLSNKKIATKSTNNNCQTFRVETSGQKLTRIRPSVQSEEQWGALMAYPTMWQGMFHSKETRRRELKRELESHYSPNDEELNALLIDIVEPLDIGQLMSEKSKRLTKANNN